MKRSADELQYNFVEINFVHAITGMEYNEANMNVDSSKTGSEIMTAFCDLTGVCIYQAKLINNNVPVKENEMLKNQFSMTEPIMTFSVYKEYKTIIDVNDFKWIDNNVERIFKVKLPKVQEFEIEFKDLKFKNVKCIELNEDDGLIFHLENGEKSMHRQYICVNPFWSGNLKNYFLEDNIFFMKIKEF